MHTKRTFCYKIGLKLCLFVFQDSYNTLLINEATALSYGVKLAVKLVKGRI